MTVSAISAAAMAPGKSSAWLPSLIFGAILAVAVAPPAAAQALDVIPILKGIENRYNTTKSLQVNFAETYAAHGRKRVEKGLLYLRKPGKMRWQYTDPEGKLFVSDGDFIYSYFPEDGKAEKMKFKETDDMRAPLAFLLGKVNFQQDFREFRASRQGENVFIAATPKSDKLPYSEVSFLAAPDFSIRKLIIKEQTGSTMEFDLTGEKRNAAVQDSLFRFQPPSGVDVVEVTQ